MNSTEFKQCFAKLKRRWDIDPELALDYYEALQSIPSGRFKEVCDRVFVECDRLPKPGVFFEFSFEIARRNIERTPQISDSKTSEISKMTDDTLIANQKRLAAMCRELTNKTIQPAVETSSEAHSPT